MKSKNLLVVIANLAIIVEPMIMENRSLPTGRQALPEREEEMQFILYNLYLLVFP